MAAGIAVTINVKDNISPKLTGLSGVITGALSNGIEAVAMQLRDLMTEYSQAGHPSHPNVISGRLSGSMQYVMPTPTYALVGSNAEYAPYVEYGHMSPSWGHGAWHFVPAYPWFTPAVNDVKTGGLGQQIFQAAVMQALTGA